MSFLYKIEGLDKEWQTSFQYNKLQFSLEPGKYNLQLALANNTPNEPSVLKTIEIIILPPFYRNWLFISLISLTGIAFVSFYIYYFQKRKYEQQLHKLEAEQKVRDEKSRISRDLHDSVGVYAHTVMYHTDLLAKEKSSNEKIINDIHFASKEMITSLRETVWAMKKDSYTAEECWLRIKNFAQSLKRHYTSIQFEIKGNTPGNWTGNHRQSLHVVRIIQEAVSNAIKHADSKELKIFSEYNMVFWTIRVSDSGKGFDIHTHKDSGNGLGNMLKRAEEAGYQLQIDTDIQNGCHIILKIPIHLD
ncbi:MAG: hypothetical protein KL787_04105 [Taibaiella sp.]|nr:hypothetical protein [Taibaiella sp.]